MAQKPKRASDGLAKKDAQKPRGRREFQPTSDQRAQVKALAMQGLSQERIAHFLQIAPKTLAKHFERELREAKPHLIARAVSTVFNAMGSSNERIALSASKYTLSTKGKQYGWTTSVDRARKRDVWRGADPARLTHEEFRWFCYLVQKMGVKLEDADLPEGMQLPTFPKTVDAGNES
jgi:hypothetical protein